MYEIVKDGARQAVANEITPTKRNRNGVYLTSSWADVEYIVADGVPYAAAEVEVNWIDGAEQLSTMENALNELGVETRE